MAEVIYVRRNGSKLEPCSLVDEEALSEFPTGKDLSVTITRPRSSKQHRFFWALIQKICENHDTYRKPEQLLLWLKIRLGYVEEVRFHDDKVWWVARSISFNAMDQKEFRKFFESALDVITEEVIPEINQYELLHEVEKMIGFNIVDLWSK